MHSPNSTEKLIINVAFPAQFGDTAPCAYNRLLPSKKCVSPGMMAELTVTILQLIIPSVQISLLPSRRFSLTDSKNSSSVLDLLHRNKADATTANLFLHPERSSLFPFLTPFLKAHPTVLFRRDRRQIASVDIFDLFPGIGWNFLIAGGIFFILIIFLRYRVAKFRYSSLRPEVPWRIAEKFCKHSELVLWALVVVFLGLLSCRVALLFNVPPKPYVPLRNLEELAEKLQSNEYSSIVGGDYFVHKFFNPHVRSDDLTKPMKILRSAYAKNPPVVERNITKGLEKLLESDRLVYIIDESLYRTYVQRGIHGCELDRLRGTDDIAPDYVTIYVSVEMEEKLKVWTKKRDVLSLDVNRLKIIHHEYERLLRKYFPEKGTCQRKSKQRNGEFKTLELTQLQNAFWFLVFSSFLSSLLLCGKENPNRNRLS